MNHEENKIQKRLKKKKKKEIPHAKRRKRHPRRNAASQNSCHVTSRNPPATGIKSSFIYTFFFSFGAREAKQKPVLPSVIELSPPTGKLYSSLAHRSRLASPVSRQACLLPLKRETRDQHSKYTARQRRAFGTRRRVKRTIKVRTKCQRSFRATRQDPLSLVPSKPRASEATHVAIKSGGSDLTKRIAQYWLSPEPLPGDA